MNENYRINFRLITILMFLISYNLVYAQVPELLYYKFDAAGTSVPNFASSPVGNNPATISGTTLTIGSTGLSGTALVGTGGSSSSNVISTGWSTSLPNGFTIAFWTSNIPTSTTLYYIWGDAGASSFRCFTNGVASANNWLVRGGGLPDLLISGAATATSNMIHVVYDKTAGTYKSYKDAVPNTTVTIPSPISVTGTGFTIGGYSSSTGLSGKMDEFRIYNRPLSQAEITATYYTTLSNYQDAGVLSFVNPDDTICEGAQAVNITLKNFGPVVLNSVNINWKVNGVSQTPYSWTGSIAVGSSANVSIGNYTFVTGPNYSITAYTSNPNGGNDTANSNDTVALNNIYVNPKPNATPTFTANTICAGDSVLIGGTLSGTAPWSITISDGTSSYTVNNILLPIFATYVSPATTTTYTVTSLSDATGCVNTSTPPIVITVIPLPEATLTPQSATTFCAGDSVILQANTGTGLTYQYQKDGIIQIGTTSTYVAYQSGSYEVIVTDTSGCDSISAPVVVIANPLPVVDLGNDTTIGVSQTLTLDAGHNFISYLWSTGDTTQTIIVDSTGIGIGTGTFSVTVTDFNTCKGTDDIDITFVTNPGIDEDQSSLMCKVFPNPAKEKINIQFFSPSLQAELVIFNALGMKIFEMKCEDNVEINTSDWPRGVYTLMLRNHKITTIKKVVIN